MDMKLYMRREQDGRFGNNKPRYKVSAYKSPKDMKPCAVWPSHYRNNPKPTDKRVVYNHALYTPVWLED